MKSETVIEVDLARSRFGPWVNAIQGDGGTRSVIIRLMDNRKPWYPPHGTEAAIAYNQPGGKKGLYNKLPDGTPALSIKGNTVTAILVPQMLSKPGDVRASVVFTNEKLDQLTSFPFTVTVAKNQFAGTQEAEDYIRLQWLEDKLDEYLQKAKDSGEFNGPKGDAFTYADFTPEQLAALTGPQGPAGDNSTSIEAAQAAHTAAQTALDAASAAQAVVDTIVPDVDHLKRDAAQIGCDYWAVSKNLYDKHFNGKSELTGKTYTNGLLSGYGISRDTGELYEVSSESTSHASYPFEVEGGRTVYIKRNNPLITTTALVFAWYDAAFKFIGATLVNASSVDLPQNAKYLAFCDDREWLYANDYLTITYDESQTVYEEYYKNARFDIEFQTVKNRLNHVEHNTLLNDSKYRAFSALFNDTENVEAFLFYTDPHLMGQAGSYDHATLKEYILAIEEAQNSVPINYVMCGGDWLVNSDTKEQACYKLGIVDGLCKKLHNHKPILGNHDTGYQGANWAIDNSKYKDDILSDNTIKNLLFRDEGNLYYKFKGANSTTFVINTGIEWWDWLTADRIVQLQWLHDELLADHSEHKVIALHAVTASETSEKYIFAQSIGKMIEAFNSRSSADISNWGASTYNFESSVGKIDYVICGHAHADFVTTLGGVPCIATSNLTNGNTPTFDLVLVDYDRSVVNLVRIGTGQNRTVNI